MITEDSPDLPQRIYSGEVDYYTLSNELQTKYWRVQRKRRIVAELIKQHPHLAQHEAEFLYDRHYQADF